MVDFWELAALLKDLLGLTGTIMIAAPFFAQEYDKTMLKKIENATVSDERLRRAFESAAHHMRRRLDLPSQSAFWLTKWGLAAIGISFAISIALTVHDFGIH